jgi:propionyl-CoA carboxylase alpha chain
LFLAAVMGHPKWKAGDFSTNFIKHAFPQGFEPLSPDRDMTIEIVCVAASIDYVVDTRAWKISGQMPRDIQERELSIFLDEQRFDIRVARQENNLTIHFAEQALSRQCQFNWIPGRLLWEGAVDGHKLIIQIRPDLDRYLLSTHGIEIKARILTRRAAELAACLPKKRIQSGSKLLLCPMPGLVKFIHVAAGQTVAAGDTLCMIEAMKMEHILRAEFGGVVKEIYAKAGELIGVDKPIMEFV